MKIKFGEIIIKFINSESVSVSFENCSNPETFGQAYHLELT